MQPNETNTAANKAAFALPLALSALGLFFAGRSVLDVHRLGDLVPQPPQDVAPPFVAADALITARTEYVGQWVLTCGYPGRIAVHEKAWFASGKKASSFSFCEYNLFSEPGAKGGVLGTYWGIEQHDQLHPDPDTSITNAVWVGPHQEVNVLFGSVTAYNEDKHPVVLGR